MLKCRPRSVSEETKRFLKARQDAVDAKESWHEQYVEAKRLFQYKSNNAFREIRSLLQEASPGGEACVYCERDRHREIEHVLPQKFYPERAFDWYNYVLACSVCNQDRKHDRCGVIERGRCIEFDRFSQIEKSDIPVGPTAVVNPRLEDPLDFFMLDLETGELVVTASDDDGERAQFTLRLFSLNDDSFLRIRRGAVMHFRFFVSEFRRSKQSGDFAAARRALVEIRNLPNPTVLFELWRQGELAI